MIIFLKSIVVGTVILATSHAAFAQSPELALNEAKTRLACGAGTPVSAQYISGGLLEVTCRQSTPSDSLPSELQGTGLTPVATAGLAVVVLVVLAGSSSSSSTTTTGN